MSYPTIIVIHGAMHIAEHYKLLIQDLEKQGYKCLTIHLPSTQSIDAPPAGLADDTAAVRNAVLDELDNEKNDVLVLAHSYGGVPANNALSGLDTKSRTENGHSTSVMGLAFMCSLPVPTGQSAGGFITSRGGNPNSAKSSVDVDPTGTFGLPKARPGAEEALYSDLPVEEAKKWAAVLQPVSLRVMGEATSYAAYQDIPTGYLYCSQDATLPLMAQEYVVAEAKKAGAKIVLEESVDAGHSPFLSKIQETTAFVTKLIECVV